MPSPQSIVHEAIVSLPGSVAARFSVYAASAACTVPAPLITSVGATLATVIACVAMAVEPLGSETVTVTVYGGPPGGLLSA